MINLPMVGMAAAHFVKMGLPADPTTTSMMNHQTLNSAAGQLRDHDPYFGMTPAMYALVFGTISGLSLPIGACLGILLSPVPPKLCALMMAFGAGALLFAVTVELYGHALREVEKGRLGLIEMFTTIFGALVGAAFYLVINHWLEEHFDKAEEEEDALSARANDEGAKSRTSSMSMSSLGDDVEGQPLPPKIETVKLTSHKHKGHGMVSALRDQQEIDEEIKAVEKQNVNVKAKAGWKKLRSHVKMMGAVSHIRKLTDSESMAKIRPREKIIRAVISPEDVRHAKSVAFALFLGLLVDGVPEGILMGFLSAEGHLTPVLLISLFVANFPEAFSSASLLIKAQMPIFVIVGMWSGLCLLVGCLCGLSCYLLLYFFPAYGAQNGHGDHAAGALPFSVLLGISLVEGLTGGSMIACISAVMLPEAFEQSGGKEEKNNWSFYTQSGFLCTAGFLMSVSMKATFG
jgi:zinc transporter ZupT